MGEKILAVDDEPRFVRLVEANLSAAGFEVVTASNGQEAIEAVSTHNPDLVLMDIMMPIVDGFTALSQIREFSTVPIIMLTAKGEEADRVEGLNRGADDYVVKPFGADELLARVRAVLRRAQLVPPPSQVNTFANGELVIDFAKAEISVSDKVVFLSATEYRLLMQFVHNVGQTLTAEDLLTNVWGEEYSTDKEILWVCISRLRQKLENDPKNPKLILTRSGLGYTMPEI